MCSILIGILGQFGEVYIEIFIRRWNIMKLKLGIITLLAALHEGVRMEESSGNIISELRKYYDIDFINPEDTSGVDLTIIFVASGGTENYFKSIYQKLTKPVILLTDGMQNSLAASLEILAWIKEYGDDSIILHGSIEEISSQINYYYQAKNTRKRLEEAVIGVVGFPSDWLIASDVNYIDARRKWGVTFKNIELDELSNQIENMSNYKAEETAKDFINRAASLKEPDEKDVKEGAKVYLALKELHDKYCFDAVTVRCFELLSKHKTTGCLALSLLNNENVISGCEGDCQTVFSMLLLYLLTGSKAFMANPSHIDIEKNEIILAHCTIPTCMTKNYDIRSHFESRIGVGIQGIVEEGRVTIFKCGGSKLDKYFLSSGQILENLNEDYMCRTQLKIRLDNDISYFLRNPIANHHLIIKGDHTKLINRFMQDMGCCRIM
jgi:L-fucose isomerase-like protein